MRHKGWIQCTHLSKKVADSKRRSAIERATAKHSAPSIQNSIQNTTNVRENIPTDSCGKEFEFEFNAIRNGPCDKHSMYRTITGDCNNLHETSRGASEIAMRRMAPTAYADGNYVMNKNLHKFICYGRQV